MSEIISKDGDGFNSAGVLVINQQDYQGYNVLTPTMTIKRANPYYDVLTAVVKLDPQRDFFNIPGTNRYAPNAMALFKLMDAAGIHPISSKSITPSICAKCRDMNRGQLIKCWECPHQYDVAQAVEVRQQQPDGTWRHIQASYEIDMVAVEAELRGIRNDATRMEKELAQIRRHRVARAETGAYSRALRKCMQIGTYTAEEIKRPFVVHRLYMDVTKLPPELKVAALRAAEETLRDNRALMRGDYEDDNDLVVGGEPMAALPAGQARAGEIVDEDDESDEGPYAAPDWAQELAENDELPQPDVDVYAIREQMHQAAKSVAAKLPSDAAVTDPQRGLLASMIAQATGHNGEDADQDRHLWCEFVWGKPSSRELSPAEMKVSLNELVDQARSNQQPRKYVVSEDGRREVNAVIAEQMRVKGQKELAL